MKRLFNNFFDFIFLITSIIVVFFLCYFLGYWGFFLSLLAIFNFFIFYLRKTNRILPVLDDFLIKKHLQAKKDLSHGKDSLLSRIAQRFWNFWFLLFVNSDSGLKKLIDDDRPLGIKFPARKTKKQQAVLELYLQEYSLIHQKNRQKAFYHTFIGSVIIVAVSVSVGLFVSLIMPFISSTSAATYSFIQTDWSGGASTTATSTHSNDRTGWNKFYSKDSNIDAGAELTLTTTSTSITHTLSSDFLGSNSNVETSTDSIALSGGPSFTDLSEEKITRYLATSTDTVNGMYVLGNYLYKIINGATSMSILDISNPDSPTVVGTWTNNESVSTKNLYKVFVKNEVIGGQNKTLAFISGYQYFYVVDVTNPAAPVASAVSKVSVGGTGVYYMVVSSSYAYLGNGSGYINIIDVSSSTNPTFTASSTSIGTGLVCTYCNMTFDNGYLYVPMGNNYNNSGAKLQIVDVTTPSSPVNRASTTANAFTGVVVSGDYAYAITNYRSASQVMYIYNISNKDSITTAASFTPALCPYGIAKLGNYIYLGGYLGAEILDVTSATAPITKMTKRDYTSSPYSDVRLIDGYVYMPTLGHVLKFAPLSSTDFLTPQGSINPGQTGYSVAVDGNNVYQTRYHSSQGDYLFIADITSPSSPVQKYFSRTNKSYLYGMAVSGDYLYSAEAALFTINNVSSTTAPTTASSSNTGVAASNDLVVSGNYVYLAGGTSGLKVIDVSSPTAPLVVGTYDTAGGASGVAVSGNYAYVADVASGLQIIDISSSTNPTLTTTLAAGTNAVKVAVVDNYAYLVDNNANAATLRIINVSSSTNPTIESTFTSTAAGAEIEVIGDYAYMIQGQVLTAINVSSPTAPVFANAYYCTSTGGTYLAKSGNTLAVNCNGVSIFNTVSYNASGNYTSQAIDTTANVGFGTVSWNATVPSGTTMSVKVRTSNNSNMSDATVWSSCSALTSGNDISSNNCVHDGDRYIQYYIEYASDASRLFSPSLNDITINYDTYPASQTLISSPFNSEDASVVLGDLSWTEDLPTGTNIKFQIRTASTSDGIWTDWLGPTGTSTYYSSASGENQINSLHSDRSGDQWVQYKVYLTSDGTNTPTLSDVNLVYVVNAPPEFESNPTASQRESDGLIEITYSVKDRDTYFEGAACSGCVVPSFEYSIDNGNNWNPITAGLSVNATSSMIIASSTYTSSTVTWDAKEQIDGIYSEVFKIRVIVNDLEGANNTATGESGAFTLDVKDPVVDRTTLGSPAIVVDASQSPAALILHTSDDTLDGLQMCISLDNSLTNCKDYAESDTINGLTSPDTVYVKFRDKFGNVGSANAVTPEKPINVIIRDVSNIDTSEFQEFIVWKAVSLPFHDYKVYYSTDGENYSLLGSAIEDRAVNYYFHKNLSAGVTYYYKVITTDGDGNVSAFSTIVADEPNGQGGTDTTPPSISGVATSSVTTQSVVITWETDELSKSYVDYSTDSSNLSSTVGSVSMVDNAAGIGPHQVTLSGLTPDTHYYFKVRSTDIGDIEATDNNSGENYEFTTLSGPAIADVAVSQVSNQGATIVWTTDVAADSYVVYSTSSDLSQSNEYGNDSSTSNHVVNLTGLSAGTVYYFYVKSGVGLANNSGNYYSFITTNDGVAPVITDVDESIVTDTATLINWTTNELSNSSVFFGTSTGSYVSSTLDVAQTTNHSVALFDLNANTTYYYIVVSTDASGNTSTSTPESTFTTLETLSEESLVIAREELARLQAIASSTASTSSSTCPVCSCGGGGGGGNTIIVSSTQDLVSPVISEVKIDNNDNKLTVLWKTDEKSTSFVEYGASSSFDLIAGQFDSVSDHSVVLRNLKVGSTYDFRVVSQDQYGNLSRSDAKNFNTGDSLSRINALPQSSEDDNGKLLMAVVGRASEMVNELSSKVSLGVLEDALSSQYNLIRQLSSVVPAPILGGEPKVTVTAESATITWSSDKKSNSLVAIASEGRYDKSKGENAYSQVVGNPDESTLMHIVTINNLEPETLYHFQVRSMSGIGSQSRSEDFTFKTRSQELEISNYTFEKVSDQKVIFRWLSNVETDSAIKYTPYHNGVLAIEEAKTVKDKAVTTLHEVAIDGFEPGLVYQVELSGKDLKGKIISKRIPDFSTGQDNLPPSIYQVQTESALSQSKDSNVQTIISWLTNEPAVGLVYYKKGTDSDDDNWEKTSLDTNYTKKHIVVITKFDPGSIYQFKIESSDSGGNIATSKVYTLLAPKQKESVFTVIVNNFEEIFGWAKRIGK